MVKLGFSWMLVLAIGSSVLGDEVRYYQQDGITYRETRRVIQRPILETKLESHDQTVYREQFQTDVRETYQTCYAPIVQYQYVPYLNGRWNPFVQPYYTYHLVPTRRYEARQQLVRMPVTRRELIPEKRTIQVPVTTQRLAQEEIITRVAVAPSQPQTLPPGGVPASSGLGGVARLESDPPRTPTGGWRSATGSPTIER